MMPHSLPRTQRPVMIGLKTLSLQNNTGVLVGMRGLRPRGGTSIVLRQRCDVIIPEFRETEVWVDDLRFLAFVH